MRIYCFTIAHALFLNVYGSRIAAMWQLYELLNTTEKIWILSRTHNEQYKGKDESCLYYTTSDLTRHSVTLWYNFVTDRQMSAIRLEAILFSRGLKAAMQVSEWHRERPAPAVSGRAEGQVKKATGITVIKELEYWNWGAKCGIFTVHLRTNTFKRRNMRDEKKPTGCVYSSFLPFPSSAVFF
ncbi:uncharacterized protein LOC142591019 isoform X2 [Dermacentor variabilis]|uniref:uncharacterized protein LOC142591019 isoform X2 n=1 Tax=Dermacentor variabilis TaxID=34621 RepID=UPI003F5BCBBF